jgi:hypothetical protein
VSQHLKKLLKDHQELRPLLTQVHVLSALQAHLAAVVPPQLAQSVQVLNLQTGTLSIAAANASIASKLRQLAPELAVLLQNRGCEVSGIRVRVQVSFDRLQPKPAPHKLSKAAQNALHDLSLSLSDSPLKIALGRLIKKN